MFIVKSNNAVDYIKATHLLAIYDVFVKIEDNMMIITEREGGREGDYTLCEMAFQMNFHQSREMLCTVCRSEIERTGEGDSVCGHITFENFIYRELKGCAA